MTPAEMADIHAAAFVSERGWTSAEFSSLLDSKHCDLFSYRGGFALTRTLAGESELLTLAVHPTRQRRGIARELLSDWINHASPIADLAFLEVAADNAGAIALYSSLSFDESGRRKGYYRRKTGPAMDAIMMTRAIS